ncbi:MAG: hypothetical protein R6X20_01765 [Phycisphaerae bacterium]
MGLKERARERRRRMVVHVAHSHEEADHPKLDLAFWASLTPQQRLEVSHAMSEAMFRVLRRHGLVP